MSEMEGGVTLRKTLTNLILHVLKRDHCPTLVQIKTHNPPIVSNIKIISTQQSGERSWSQILPTKENQNLTIPNWFLRVHYFV